MDALKKAKDAGLFVIALDTPPDPADAADITFATDNFAAGELIGEWTAAQLDGEEGDHRPLDLFDDKVVSVDYNRDQGFLDRHGHRHRGQEEERRRGQDRARYSGGDYEIVGNQASQGAEDGGRTAMETLLSKNPDINVVYTINEPAAVRRLRGAEGRRQGKGRLVVSVDGGCAGVNNVKDGVIGATAQQYPVKMAELGVQAIVDLAKTGEKPSQLTGARLLQHRRRARHRRAADGVKSITTAEAADICWG